MLASHFLSPLRKITIAAGILLFTVSSATAATYVSVKGDNINVRTGPGTDNPIRMELFDGYPLQVIATEGEWLKVSDYEQDSGWIHNSLVADGNTVIVNGANSVNMRAEPSTQSAIIANVDRGVVLTKVETRGNWLKVKHASGLDGWIYKPLLWP